MSIVTPVNGISSEYALILILIYKRMWPSGIDYVVGGIALILAS